MIIPESVQLKPQMLHEVKFNDNVSIATFLVPTWPCYAKDGAGKLTNVHLEQELRMFGKTYRLTETTDES